MYRVLMRKGWNGPEQVIHSELSARDGPRLLAGKVTKAVGSYPTAEITVYPSNPAYANIDPFQTFIRVVRVDKRKTLFNGRAYTLEPAMATDGTITEVASFVGLADFLHDSVQPWAEFHNITPKDFLQALIDQHNQQVEPYKQIKLGNVTVTNSTDNVYRYTDDTKDTYDTITEKLINRLGGEIRVRLESDGLYLDYMPEIAEHSNQVIKLSSNLMSLSQKTDPSKVITVLKPLGKAAERTTTSTTGDTNTATSTPRLTISSVNNGSPFLTDSNLVAQFGIHVVSQTWDDVTTAAALKTKGDAVLASQSPVSETLQLNAVDLSLVDVAVDDIDCGNYYRVVNPLMAYDKEPRVVGQELDICEPENSTLTAGDAALSQESYTLQLIDQAEQAQLTADYYKSIIDGYDSQLSEITKEVDALKNSSGSGEVTYYDGNIIDVSEFQGSINWSSVVGAGLALAVIRVQSGSDHEDLTYKTNIPAAISAGANYGVYAYFNGLSVSDSEVEATNFYNRAQAVIGSNRKPRLYMIDVESNTVTSGTLSASVTAYLNTLNALGVPDSQIVIYVSNALHDSIDTTRTQIWIPSYGANDGTITNSIKPLYSYDLWQYTSQGHVAGITANTVDMSADPSARFKSAFLTK